jgi:hypothetical protein
MTIATTSKASTHEFDSDFEEENYLVRNYPYLLSQSDLLNIIQTNVNIDQRNEWCHLSKLLKMHSRLPMKIPHSPRETQHLHPGDAVICHRGCIILFRNAYPRREIPRLPREMPYLHREMWVLLQNSRYVTLLRMQHDFISPSFYISSIICWMVTQLERWNTNVVSK